MSQEHLLCGWDGTTGEWIKLQVDENGYVKVDLSAVNLDDLADVNAPAPDDDDALTWDAATEKWIPEAIAAGGYTEGARVYKSAVQSIPDGPWTYLSFDLENYDTDEIHHLVTNNSRLTCKTAGKYIVMGLVSWALPIGHCVAAYIIKGRTTDFGYQSMPAAICPGWTPNLLISTIIALAVNEYVEIAVLQNSGVALNVGTGSWFAMQRIG